VPITSVKHWAALVNKLSVLQLPPFAMIVEVSVHNDAKTMFRTGFAAGARLRTRMCRCVDGAHREWRNNMAMPYPKRDAEVTAAAPAKTGKF
jgi:hypothetical protein